MKNILTKFIDEPSKNLLIQNELKIYNHLSNEERNNNSNDKILSLLKDELLYSLNDEEDKLIKIHATIYVERESQKGIIIGKRGAMLKKVGMAARTEIEAFFEKKVFLELFVKVEKDWRNKDKQLKLFGYPLNNQ